jgi:predicted negative regulator of RcsB-dependent stress response
MKDIVLRVGGLILAILLIVGGFLFWDSYRNKKLQELSYKEYEIRKLLQAGNYQKALELIKSFPSKDRNLHALALSYELYLSLQGQKVEEKEVLKSIIEGIKDKELKSLYRERYAYALFKGGDRQSALKELSQIGEEDFNYPSSLLLKAQILASEGKNKEAREAYEKLLKIAPNSYFANVAQAMLSGD